MTQDPHSDPHSELCVTELSITFFDGSKHFSATTISRLLSDIQRVVNLFGLLAERHSLTPEDLFYLRLLDDFDFGPSNSMEYLREASHPRLLNNFELFVTEISVRSPLQVVVGFVHRAAATAKVVLLFEYFKKATCLDLTRARMTIQNAKLAIQNERERQKLIHDQLLNYELAERILSGVESKEEKALIQRHIFSATSPFVDGRYPAIETVAITTASNIMDGRPGESF